MINKSIAYRLSFYISIAVISVFVTFIIANFLLNRKLLRENIENKAIGLSKEVNSLVNLNIVTITEVTKNVASQIVYYSENNDAEELLQMVMEKYPFLNAIHANLDSSISSPARNFYFFRDNEEIRRDLGNLSEYFNYENKLIQEIEDKTTAGWTEPYRTSRKGIVAVSYYFPIYVNLNGQDSVYAGHIFSELSLTELNKAINQMEIGKQGYAFLINKTGEYITHPVENRILNRDIYSLPAKTPNKQKIDFENILAKGLSGSTILYPEIFNFKKSWVYYTPVNENRWYLIFVMPYYEVFSSLYWVTFGMLFFALVVIVIIFFIIVFITRKLVEPLSDVTSRLSELGNPGNKLFHTRNEVKQVTASLEYLKSLFEEYRIASEHEEKMSLRRKEDLQQASEIQHSLIKTNFPAFPYRNDIDLFAVYKPARVVSGDLFDYFFIDDENLMFTIGDVSGKGIPAAIFMSVAQTIIKNNSSFKKAKTIVNKSNVELCTSNQHQFFLTLFLGILNVKTGILNFCNAAHNFTYILKPNGKIEELDFTHGLPLGLYPDKMYDDTRVTIEKGDTLILYTDGIPEMQNEQKIHFGIDQFKENLIKLKGLPPSEMVNKMVNKLETYRGNYPQEDDYCLFVINYTP